MNDTALGRKFKSAGVTAVTFNPNGLRATAGFGDDFRQGGIIGKPAPAWAFQ
jgi:hypothetical protein